MNPLRKNLEQIWEQLRGQKPSRTNYLEEVQVRGLRGIKELRVPLPFPVTVLAGPNGCGKSTVLFALACAYKLPGRQQRGSEFTPARIFPDFRPHKRDESTTIYDERSGVDITFAYVVENNRQQMKWSRGKGKWNRSFFGRKRGSQPHRVTYLRTLANLSNPSELRSVLQLVFKSFSSQEIDASNIAFAQRILRYRYSKITLLTAGIRNLLFAERSGEESGGSPRYSEFHMSAGERSLLRLSIEVSKQEDALILIDEVEAGLHPYIQQLLMLELQRLSLRNSLQIVVTTHSPAVLETVPTEARVFLERTDDNVVRREPYRDLIQKALYGRSQNVLSILCEDEEAEELVRGVLEFLGPKLDLLQNDIDIGRNTGKDEFPAHLETLARFRKLSDMVFVLDGDGRIVGANLEARAAKHGQVSQVVYLPGNGSPEEWAWGLLGRQTERYSVELGIAAAELQKLLKEMDSIYSSAADKPAAIAKGKLTSLGEAIAKTPPAIMRLIGKKEAEVAEGEVYELASHIEDIVRQWRAVTL